jgi:hypothetical protein
MARPKLKITKELINAEVPRVAERYALTRLFEKSVLKDADDTSCQINELLERVNQAPRSGGLDIAKSYAEVQVHLALNFSMQGMHKQDYRLFIQVAPRLGHFEDVVLGGVEARKRLQNEIVFKANVRPDHRHDDLVFLHAIEPMQPPQEPVKTASLVWLEFLESGCEGRKPLLYFSLTERRFKFFPCLLYREPCVLNHDHAAPRGGSRDEVVERGAQPVENFPAHDAHLKGRLLNQSELASYFPFSRIDLGDDFVAVRGHKEIKVAIDLRDVAVGPFNL